VSPRLGCELRGWRQQDSGWRCLWTPAEAIWPDAPTLVLSAAGAWLTASVIVMATGVPPPSDLTVAYERGCDQIAEGPGWR
jgi:hypothetical protein